MLLIELFSSFFVANAVHLLDDDRNPRDKESPYTRYSRPKEKSYFECYHTGAGIDAYQYHT